MDDDTAARRRSVAAGLGVTRPLRRPGWLLVLVGRPSLNEPGCFFQLESDVRRRRLQKAEGCERMRFHGNVT